MAKPLEQYKCLHCNSEFFPNKETQLCCSHKCSNKYQAKIRKETIDPKTGMSLSKIYSNRAAIAIKKAGFYGSKKHREQAAFNLKKTLSQSGVRDKLKIALQNRKIKNKDGLSAAQKSAIKAMRTKAQKGMLVPIEQKPEFERYKFLVDHFTRNANLASLENSNKRGRAKNGVQSYHLDHIYSVFDGFNNNVPPEIIGDISNLRYIPWYENVSKNYKSDCSLNELFEKAGRLFCQYYPDNYVEIKKEKCSARKMNDMRITCSFCNKTTTPGNHSRWHGVRCKLALLNHSDILDD